MVKLVGMQLNALFFFSVVVKPSCVPEGLKEFLSSHISGKNGQVFGVRRLTVWVIKHREKVLFSAEHKVNRASICLRQLPVWKQ